DRSGWRNLGAAGLGWFLLIAIGFTGWFVVVLPLRADPLANDLTQVYIAVSIARDHGWSHIYSLVLQQDLFERLRPHAVWNDGACHDRDGGRGVAAWGVTQALPGRSRAGAVSDQTAARSRASGRAADRRQVADPAAVGGDRRRARSPLCARARVDGIAGLHGDARAAGQDGEQPVLHARLPNRSRPTRLSPFRRCHSRVSAH